MNSIAYDTRNTNYDTSYSYATQARDLSERIGYKVGLASSIRFIGIILSNQGRFNEALDTILKSLALIRQIGHHEEDEAMILNNIGYVLKSTEQYIQALEYFQQSLQIFRRIQHNRGIALVLGNIGDVYFLRRNYDKALEYEKQALEYARQNHSTNYIIGVTLFHIATIHTKSQRYDSAHFYQEQALKLFQNDNISKYTAKSLNNLAEVAFMQHQYKQSIQYGEKGLAIARSIASYEEAARISHTLAEAWKSLGNSKVSLQYFQTYVEWKDSLTALNLQQKLEQFRSTQEVAEKQKKIQILEKDRENQELLRNSLVGGVLFSFVLLVVAVNRYRTKQHSENLLKQKQLQLEEQAREIQLTNTQLHEAYTNISAISEIGREITATLDKESVFSKLYDAVQHILDAPIFAVGVLNETQQEIELLFGIESNERMPIIRYGMHETNRIAVQCALSRKEIIIHNLDEEYVHYTSQRLPPKFGQKTSSLLYFPLIVEARLIGVLSVQSFSTNAYAEYQIEMMRALSSYSAIALDNSIAYDKLDKARQREQEVQRQLLQAEKMASLGTLVAGIAHEINTPIGVAITAASTLHGRTSAFQERYTEGGLKKSELEAYIQTAQIGTDLTLRNLERAASLVQSFKQVAVDQTSDAKRQFKLNAYLHEIITSLQPKLNSTQYRVEIECDETLELETYPGAIAQIITNFVTNSLLHGFEGYKDEGIMRIKADELQGKVWLRYSDNGRGIPSDVLPRIFDPFFTTKQAQGGTGLGMHIVYNLVTQKLGGEIRCESEMGKGTTFSAELPM